MIKSCEKCGVMHNTRKKEKRFCSRKCYLDFNKGSNHPRFKHGNSRGSKTKCINCHKEIIRTAMNQKYCSQSCQLKYEYKNGLRDKIKITKKANEEVRKKSLEKFKNNPTIYINARGYKEIYIPGKGKKKYHHYVWEKSGRNISEGFCLHHINGDKLDNRLKNLIMITHKDHHKLHNAERERDDGGRYI